MNNLREIRVPEAVILKLPYQTNHSNLTNQGEPQEANDEASLDFVYVGILRVFIYEMAAELIRVYGNVEIAKAW